MAFINVFRIRQFILFLTFFQLCLCNFSCRQAVQESHSLYKFDTPLKAHTFKNAAVVSAHPLASEAGESILKQGGNAIDAAIAVQFALAVCYPVAGNIGGGGFMVYRNPEGEFSALDFRETAPAKASRDMYLDSSGQVIKDLSLKGHLACGVPGTVDGMWEAFNKYSKLKDWSILLEPAIQIANNGFEISESQARRLNSNQQDFIDVNHFTPVFCKKRKWKAGHVLQQKELAAVLVEIAKSGRDGFYNSWVSELLIDEMNRGGGMISHEDLTNYRSKWREPVYSNYKNYKVISMSPPSSGGIALSQLLNAIENYPIHEWDFHSSEYIHLLVEAERRVYADRATYLGDPDFFEVPKASLLDKQYMIERMQDYDPGQASLSSSVQAGTIQESEETTHFSIVDQYGNAVSLTTTINTAFGSKVVVEGAGFIMNNEMDDFSAKPGVPNYFGLVGNEANAIQPGKRMLSSMTPAIIEKDDDLFMVVGTPGGSTIITSVLQTILNVIEHGMSAEEATHACRFHHQWLPNLVFVEKDCWSNEMTGKLESMGHTIKERSPIGKVETIVVQSNGFLDAAADNRGDDSVAGF